MSKSSRNRSFLLVPTKNLYTQQALDPEVVGGWAVKASMGKPLVLDPVTRGGIQDVREVR